MSKVRSNNWRFKSSFLSSPLLFIFPVAPPFPSFLQKPFRKLGECPLCPMANNCQASRRARFTVVTQVSEQFPRPQMLLAVNQEIVDEYFHEKFLSCQHLFFSISVDEHNKSVKKMKKKGNEVAHRCFVITDTKKLSWPSAPSKVLINSWDVSWELSQAKLNRPQVVFERKLCVHLNWKFHSIRKFSTEKIIAPPGLVHEYSRDANCETTFYKPWKHLESWGLSDFQLNYIPFYKTRVG